jgi:release factor glutamine methyltransferase
VSESAWFCGENFEYFENLFNQLNGLNTQKTSVLMILSDACELELIQKIAHKNGFELILKHEVKLTFEVNLIYELKAL